MSESGPDTGTSATPDTGQSNQPDTGNTATDTATDTTDWKAEAEKFRELHRKQEERAKANAHASKELDRLRRESMSDTERAVSEAAEAARAEAVADVVGRLGGRLVVSEIRNAVAGRLTAEQLDAVVEHLDLSGFLSADGEVDEPAVAAFAQRIAPETTSSPTFPDLGQGARAPAVNGGAPDPLLSALKGKLGISG
jgi:hypothetical protein